MSVGIAVSTLKGTQEALPNSRAPTTWLRPLTLAIPAVRLLLSTNWMESLGALVPGTGDNHSNVPAAASDSRD